MASEQEYKTREVPVERTVPSEQEFSKEVEVPAAGSHKPSMMEQVKEKVADVKGKITGHGHQASPTKHAGSDHETHAATASPQSPKGESFLQKVKEKVPGTQAHQHKTAATTTTPGPTGTATEPAAHTGEPAAHKEGIGEKVRHMFKGGHFDAKTEQTREVPPSREGEGVTERDILKE